MRASRSASSAAVSVFAAVVDLLVRRFGGAGDGFHRWRCVGRLCGSDPPLVRRFDVRSEFGIPLYQKPACDGRWRVGQQLAAPVCDAEQPAPRLFNEACLEQLRLRPARAIVDHGLSGLVPLRSLLWRQLELLNQMADRVLNGNLTAATRQLEEGQHQCLVVGDGHSYPPDELS
jgi:hypothetical protein